MLVDMKLTTADELLALSSSSDKRHVLLRGELITMPPPGAEHGALAVTLASALNAFARSHQSGQVFVETGFRLESNPDTVLAPDVSFISSGRLPPGGLPQGYFPGAPDLAVEVVSPGDLDEEVAAKVACYLQAGARQVWVVRPRGRSLTVHSPDGLARTLDAGAVLPGGDLLPGFSLPLGELFA